MPPPSSPPTSPRTVAACLLLLTLAGFVHRQVGIGYQLPHAPEPDALIVGQALWLEARAAGEATDAQMAPHYPLLLGALVHAVLGRLQAPPPALGDLQAALRAAARPYVAARRILAALAALLLPATFFLARRFLPPWSALLAAAFVATSLLHLDFSQQARPHGALASFCAFALLAQMRYLERGGARALAAAVLLSALALASLHNGVFVVSSFALALLLRARRERRNPWPGLLAWIPLVVVLALPAYASPYQLDADQRLSLRGSLLDLSGHVVFLEHFDGSGFARMAGLLALYDPVLLGLAALGAVAAVARTLRHGLPAPAALVLAYVLPYVVLLGCYAHTVERFLIPLLPYLACLAAWSVHLANAALLRRGASGRVGAAAATCLAVALLALPAWGSARLSVLRTRPDTAQLAAVWIREHVERERDVVHLSTALTLPLACERAALGLEPQWLLSPWERYQVRHPSVQQAAEPYLLRRIFATDSGGAPSLSAGAVAAVLRRNAAPQGEDWVVLRPMLLAGAADETPAALRALGSEPVHVIDPFRAGHRGAGDDIPSRGLRAVLALERLGRRLEVHRLPGPRLDPAGRPAEVPSAR